MKILNTKMVKGVKTVTVELDEGEQLVAFRPTGMYELGEPHEDIMPGHVLLESAPVIWCSLEQGWIK
jgi:hypothetical protein